MEVVEGAIARALSAHDYTTATWLCEQAHAAVVEPSSAAADAPLSLTLATCYYRAGKPHRTYSVLKGCTHPDHTFLFALACYDLGKLYEAELALAAPHAPDGNLKRASPRGKLRDSKARIAGSDTDLSPPALALMGRICSRTGRTADAVSYYERAIQRDPLLWSAHEALSLLTGAGAGRTVNRQSGREDTRPEVKARFADLPDVAARSSLTPGKSGSRVSSPYSRSPSPSASRSPWALVPQTLPLKEPISPGAREPARKAARTSRGGRLVTDTNRTRGAHRTPEGQGGTRAVAMETGGDGHTIPAAAPPLGPGPPAPRKVRRVTDSKTQAQAQAQGQGVASRRSAIPIPASAGLALPRAHATTRSDKRPPSGAGAVTGSGSGSGPGSLPKHPQQPHLHRSPSPSPSPDPTPGIGPGPSSGILAALAQMAHAFALQCAFRCKEALEAYSQLPRPHGNTGWVRAQVGRCHFELAQYPAAVASFEAMRRVEPHRTAGLEYYSTALWHLRREVELAKLAHDAANLDRQAAHTWMVIGNCFSLQKDHENAVNFFRRAAQLDPLNPYPYTLAGHELVANESFDAAQTTFRQALSLDANHYNAHYGLGNLYLRQERFDAAVEHLRLAVRINPANSVLHCYLGTALSASRRHDEALQALAVASALDPSNPLVSFQRATVLAAQARYQAAIDELETVRRYAPREASVHYTLGKLHKRLGNKEQALSSYLIALDLDSKSQEIRIAIEQIGADELEAEEPEPL